MKKTTAGGLCATAIYLIAASSVVKAGNSDGGISLDEKMNVFHYHSEMEVTAGTENVAFFQDTTRKNRGNGNQSQQGSNQNSNRQNRTNSSQRGEGTKTRSGSTVDREITGDTDTPMIRRGTGSGSARNGVNGNNRTGTKSGSTNEGTIRKSGNKTGSPGTKSGSGSKKGTTNKTGTRSGATGTGSGSGTGTGSGNNQ